VIHEAHDAAIADVRATMRRLRTVRSPIIEAIIFTKPSGPWIGAQALRKGVMKLSCCAV